jgi:RNA recognition motif-containing protein
VEYATREQAQNAVATLSNQNLMGRLVYVREDREAEPRFSAPGGGRGDFGGGMARGGGGYGGFGGHAAAGGAGAGRQVYVANVCTPFHYSFVPTLAATCANSESSFLTMLAGKT